MNTKKIKIVIISIVIVIIMIIIGLSTLIISMNNQSTSSNNENIINEQVPSSNKGSKVKIQDEKELYIIEKIINSGITSSFEISHDQLGLDIEVDKEIYDNFLKNLNISNEEKSFHINEAYSIEISEKYNIYFAQGYLMSKNVFENTENLPQRVPMQFTVVKDKDTGTCWIEKYGDNYKKIFDYSENIEDIEINTDRLSEFEVESQIETYSKNIEETTSEEDIAKWFYEDYRIKAIYFPAEAYEFLEEDYKKERFENNFDNFQEYISETREALIEAKLKQYSSNEKNGDTLYTLVDSKQNSYFVSVSEGLQNYKIKLDNYTIKLDDYEAKYQKMSDESKVAANAYIFIQMINTKDYKHAYELLDSTFRQNNFNNLDSFKEYVKDNFYNINYNDSSYDIDTQSDYYTCICKIKDSNEENAQEKTLNIVMQLKEGTDFVMSFSIE